MSAASRLVSRFRGFLGGRLLSGGLLSGRLAPRGRTGNPVERSATDAVEFTIRNVRHLIEMIGEGPEALRGRTFLEIGPGMDLGICLCVAGLGGKAIALDRFLAGWDDTLHPAIYERLIVAAKATWTGFDEMPIRTCLRRGGHEADRLTAIARGLEEADAIGDAEVDFTYSNATFEHLADVPAAIASMARIMKLGGRGFHQTDFRDHRSMDRPLEFLTIPASEFARLLVASEHSCGNRVRPHEFIGLFERHGFDAAFRPNMLADEAYLRSVRPRLVEPYASLSDDELRPISGRFHVRRVGRRERDE
ncbi:MAG TPA: methyltransferase domain-containing protein [Phycisphaerales bacterium]|nr:methyltransferase domain-containing protein [Phycisphaerales bacterium]HMP37921.1 methyltransferase domain-containing protein [Phycisphaerales bacterium]